MIAVVLADLVNRNDVGMITTATAALYPEYRNEMSRVTGYLDELATKRGVVRFDAMLERRLAGEPLQYVLGSWGFRTLDLIVDRRVLIPRPETEVVAGLALAELDRLAEPGRMLTAVDLGTGSGAIGLSLAAERTDTHVILTDASTEAVPRSFSRISGTIYAAYLL